MMHSEGSKHRHSSKDRFAHTTEASLFRQALENIMEGVFFLDKQGEITFWNRSAERISGYNRDEVIGSKCSDRIFRRIDKNGCELSLNSLLLATAEDLKPKDVELFLYHKNGYRVPISARSTPITGSRGTSGGTIHVFSDLSERSSILKDLEILKKEVFTDSVTGLGNRRFAESNLTEALLARENDHDSFGILLLDVDHFKSINDSYGHSIGDRALRMVGWTLANAVRRNDAAARWGGDEFIVLCPKIGVDRLREVAERIKALVEHSVLGLVNGDTISVTMSIGGTIARQEDCFESLISRADEQMYFSKTTGRNRVSILGSDPGCDVETSADLA